MFYLRRKIKRCRVKEMTQLDGLLIKPRGSKNSTIKVKNILICDKNFKNNYIKKQLDNKFSKLYKKIYKFLVSGDDSEEGVKSCLGEIEKTKSIIFSKYKEHMKNKLYKEYLAKIVLTENEFRDKYMQRQYFSKMLDKTFSNYNFLEEEKGKSR